LKIDWIRSNFDDDQFFYAAFIEKNAIEGQMQHYAALSEALTASIRSANQRAGNGPSLESSAADVEDAEKKTEDSLPRAASLAAEKSVPQSLVADDEGKSIVSLSWPGKVFWIIGFFALLLAIGLNGFVYWKLRQFERSSVFVPQANTWSQSHDESLLRTLTGPSWCGPGSGVERYRTKPSTSLQPH
jgi:hypothetical protein